MQKISRLPDCTDSGTWARSSWNGLHQRITLRCSYQERQKSQFLKQMIQDQCKDDIIIEWLWRWKKIKIHIQECNIIVLKMIMIVKMNKIKNHVQECIIIVLKMIMIDNDNDCYYEKKSHNWCLGVQHHCSQLSRYLWPRQDLREITCC